MWSSLLFSIRINYLELLHAVIKSHFPVALFIEEKILMKTDHPCLFLLFGFHIAIKKPKQSTELNLETAPQLGKSNISPYHLLEEYESDKVYHSHLHSSCNFPCEL